MRGLVPGSTFDRGGRARIFGFDERVNGASIAVLAPGEAQSGGLGNGAGEETDSTLWESNMMKREAVQRLVRLWGLGGPVSSMRGIRRQGR